MRAYLQRAKVPIDTLGQVPHRQNAILRKRDPVWADALAQCTPRNDREDRSHRFHFAARDIGARTHCLAAGSTKKIQTWKPITVAHWIKSFHRSDLDVYTMRSKIMRMNSSMAIARKSAGTVFSERICAIPPPRKLRGVNRSDQVRTVAPPGASPGRRHADARPRGMRTHKCQVLVQLARKVIEKDDCERKHDQVRHEHVHVVVGSCHARAPPGPPSSVDELGAPCPLVVMPWSSCVRAALARVDVPSDVPTSTTRFSKLTEAVHGHHSSRDARAASASATWARCAVRRGQSPAEVFPSHAR